jgi:hypothetical protein
VYSNSITAADIYDGFLFLFIRNLTGDTFHKTK